MMIMVPQGDRRPTWLIAQEFYSRVASELEEIARTGGIRTRYGVFPVSPRGRVRAAKQAALHRAVAAQLERERPPFEEVQHADAA